MRGDQEEFEEIAEMALVTETQDAAAAGHGANATQRCVTFDVFDEDYQQVYKYTILSY